MKIKTIFLFQIALFLFGSSSYSKKLSLGVYAWSGCFEKLKMSEIVKFIKTEDIKRIELSYRPFVERKDIRDLVRKLSKSGKKIDIVLSEPTYIFSEKWHEIRSKLIYIFKSGYNVHLDLEPHILHDFKEKKEIYLKLFVNLLEKVHLIANKYGKKVSVAINMNHYKDVIEDIFSNSDLVVFMAYGFKNAKKIKEIIYSYKKEKVALALRAKDFTNEDKLFRLISNITKLTGIKIFIIQNLREWIKLK